MTEAAIDAGLHARLYVSLGEPVATARRLERARLRQAVRRLDLGRLPDMALGGLLAATDRRYRARRQPRRRAAMPRRRAAARRA